jgi:hypothetical protein
VGFIIVSGQNNLVEKANFGLNDFRFYEGINVCVCVCVCVCIYIYTFVCMYVYIYIYVYVLCMTDNE